MTLDKPSEVGSGAAGGVAARSPRAEPRGPVGGLARPPVHCCPRRGSVARRHPRLRPGEPGCGREPPRGRSTSRPANTSPSARSPAGTGRTGEPRPGDRQCRSGWYGRRRPPDGSGRVVLSWLTSRLGSVSIKDGNFGSQCGWSVACPRPRPGAQRWSSWAAGPGSLCPGYAARRPRTGGAGLRRQRDKALTKVQPAWHSGGSVVRRLGRVQALVRPAC